MLHFLSCSVQFCFHLTSSQLVNDRVFLERIHENRNTKVATWVWGGGGSVRLLQRSSEGHGKVRGRLIRNFYQMEMFTCARVVFYLITLEIYLCDVKYPNTNGT
jgi:hypothetical protein